MTVLSHNKVFVIHDDDAVLGRKMVEDAESQLRKNESIVCKNNILAGVQTLVWACQTKVWTPFSGILYSFS